MLSIRIFSLTYFCFAMLGTLTMIALSIHYAHRVDWIYELRLLAQGLICGFGMLYGYNGICVLVSRRAERLGLTLIRQVMNSAEAEEIIAELLAAR